MSHHGRGQRQSSVLQKPFIDWAASEFEQRPQAPLCLYLHVPFCRHRCAFCPFYRNGHQEGFSADYAALLKKDITMTSKALGEARKHRRIDAVYFGGGTPSDMEAEDLAGIIRELKQNFAIDEHTEITVEGRVRDFTEEKATAWVDAGANRFSLGLQSTDVPLRRRLGRLADREEILSVLLMLSATDALVIVDLIYGLPGQSIQSIAEDIRFLAEETQIDGLDLYELKQFPGSPLAKMLGTGRIDPAPKTEERAAFFRTAHNLLDAYGFDHFTRQHWRRNPKERSVYNRLAKKDTDLLPFGSGAGGRLGNVSISREPLLANWKECLAKGEIPARFINSEAKNEFQTALSEAVEERSLPALSSWPKASASWRENLVSNWQEAGLVEVWEDNDTEIRLTGAGCYWSGHLQQLILQADASGSLS